ncbi:MAG: hypothetical protein ACTSW2_07140 [Alphaproteobacteria bacterium]
MPAAAQTADPIGAEADKSGSDDCWYSAFATAADNAKGKPAAAPDTASNTSVLDTLDTLTLSDIPGPHARDGADDSTMSSLVRQQQAELERMVQDNAQLMGRIETLLQIQGREQVLRQQLQNQVDRIDERMKLAPPAGTLDAVRREARAGVTEEIKPVLMAILDALERFNDKTEIAAAPVESAESKTTIMDEPFIREDYGKLPLILTRPLGELMEDVSDPGRSNSGSSHRQPRKNLFSNRKRNHVRVSADRENTDGPVSSTWTTVISS